MAASSVFFDSNILVYTDDPRDPRKAHVAAALVAQHMAAGTGAISTQVLQEYYSATTSKVGTEPAIARRKIEIYAAMTVAQIDVALILAAVDLRHLHRLSLWDALILQAAHAVGCAVLYSEDLQSGSSIAGVRIVNPF